MNIKELFDLQRAMETKAINLSGIDESALGENNILNVRTLALQVKIGELANLTKCYKYQKDMTTIPKNKMLFRYIEGMIYLLSLGNRYQLNIIDDHAFDNVATNEDLIVTFSEIYEGITGLKDTLEKDRYVEALRNYITIFAKYLHLGRSLNISYDEAMTYFNTMEISA